MSEVEFIAKVEYEGGIIEALDYGLHEKVLPPGDLRDAWRDLRVAYVAMQPALRKVEHLIPDSAW